jgi:hypothetical protein
LLLELVMLGRWLDILLPPLFNELIGARWLLPLDCSLLETTLFRLLPPWEAPLRLLWTKCLID